jgi:hypothetical protein
MLLWMLGCSGSSVQLGADPEEAAAVPLGPAVGEQHPPIPADNEAWKDDSPGFRPAFFFYGERSWADVKMRVLSHIAAVERDRARLAALAGRPAAAASIYAALAERLHAIELSSSLHAVQIRDLLAAAAQRDSRLLQGVADGAIPAALQGAGGHAGRRASLMHWTLGDANRPSAAQRAAWLDSMKAALLLVPTTGQGEFEDFDDRHKLRVSLVRRYLDVVDPVGFSDSWGYWGPGQTRRQLAALGQVAQEAVPAALARGRPGWQHPSLLAAKMLAPGVEARFSVDGLGGLPTGDSLVDVAGSPGPTAIGKLARLSVEDPDHRAWLTTEAGALGEALAAAPGSVQARLQQTTEALDAHGHGSRYYNIKAARNEAVRVLARAGRYAEAREVLLLNRPLHHQDWACPNRDGILRAIEGRLLALAGNSRADEVLRAAREASEGFLQEVAKAEAAGH